MPVPQSLPCPRFQPPPHRTQHADFPHYALLHTSGQGLCDLSCWGHCRRSGLKLSLPYLVHPRTLVSPRFGGGSGLKLDPEVLLRDEVRLPSLRRGEWIETASPRTPTPGPTWSPLASIAELRVLVNLMPERERLRHVTLHRRFDFVIDHARWLDPLGICGRAHRQNETQGNCKDGVMGRHVADCTERPTLRPPSSLNL